MNIIIKNKKEVDTFFSAIMDAGNTAVAIPGIKVDSKELNRGWRCLETGDSIIFDYVEDVPNY